MEVQLMDFLRPETIIEYGGIALLLFIIFAETGLFFGFFLPGDSLLFVAGLLCGTPYLALPLWLLIALVIVTAAAGTTVGYGFGFWAKDYFAKRKDNFFYRKQYIDVTQQFFRKYGMITFIIGRFLPIVRTFLPILAGIAHIDFKKFLLYNFLGTVCWVIPLTCSGYLLGKSFPGIIEHLDWIVLGMILFSSTPFIVSWMRQRYAEK